MKEYFFDDIESCECIGQFEDEYVYDIEMNDDTHTFIANDMLVHNSLYISFTPIMNSIGYKGDELKFMLHINGVFVKHFFNDLLEKYAKPYGVKNLHDFELETINESGLHIEKKNYINNCVYEDGVFYDSLTHFNSKGVEIVKSSTPSFVRENIWDYIKYLFKHPIDFNIKEIIKLLKDVKKQFMMAPIEDISMTTSLTNYEQKMVDDQNSMECVKGAHFSIKAAATHNYILNKHSEFKTKYDLLKSGKIKYYCIKHSLNNRFAYLRNFHPSEITEMEGIQIDYDEQFEKTFLKICNRFSEPMGIPQINKRLSVLTSIFNINKIAPVEIDEEDIEEDDDEVVINSDDLDFDSFNMDDPDDIEETKFEDVEPINQEIKKVDVDDFWN